jgi:hypothetical protein
MLTQILTLIRTKQRDIRHESISRLPWISEPSRRFNLLFNTEGSGIQGISRLRSERIIWQNSSWTSYCTKAEGQRREIVSCLAVLSESGQELGSVFTNSDHYLCSDTQEDTLSNHQWPGRGIQLSMRKIMCRREKLSSTPSFSLSCSNPKKVYLLKSSLCWNLNALLLCWTQISDF